MNLFKKNKLKYEIIHDNLNDQWIIADLSNKKYNFYYRNFEFEKNYKKNHIGNLSQNIKTNNLWHSITPMIIIACIFLLLLIQMRQPISNDYIFKQYYTENIIDITRDDKNNEAIVKFQQKDFNAASELFLNILSKDTSNIAVYFYYGISNIETKNYNIAINTFNKIIKQNDNLYIEHAEWYKGLCYLKSNQKNKAINEFTKIANNPDNYYNKKAKDILEKLN
jgi:hypothetical protein